MFEFPKVPVDQISEKNDFYIFPKGIYHFRIEEAESKISDKGNPMLALIIIISDNAGHTGKVWDYIVSDPKMAWKHHHLCMSIGHEEFYTDQKINVNVLVGMGGMVELGIKDDPNYKRKNKVIDYVLRGTTTATTGDTPANVSDDGFNDGFNDGISF